MVEKKQQEKVEEIEKKAETGSSVSKTKSEKNLWKVLTVILGIVIVVLLVVTFKGGITGMFVSKSDAPEKLIAYLNSRSGGGVELVSSEDLGSLYRVTVSYKGDQIPVYVTKDGKYFVQGAIPITGEVIQPTQEQEQPQQIQKSDKPKVEAFVFSYCPYGLQFQKALVPVYNLLKDKADIELVAIGAMHGEYEKQESLRQICIKKEYGKDKLWKYLEKFMGDTKIGNCKDNMECSKPLVEKIMGQLGIDKNKINSCMQKDAETLYNAENARARELGISGSPTFVINGVQVQVGRTPQAIKEAICSAFNTQPEECKQTLSAQSATPGFGSSASASGNSAASCG